MDDDARDPSDIELAQAALRDRLLEAGLLISTDVEGLYGRNSTFERVLAAVDHQACTLGSAEQPEAVEFPPVFPRSTFERIGYLQTFPHLAGTVFSFMGNDREHKAMLSGIAEGATYSDALSQTDFALLPACCYPVYAMATGALPEAGRTFELSNYCFRHEPSIDPMRMVAFRQREHVRLGSPEQVAQWRARWFERVPTLFAELGLETSTDAASDAFFGRAGRFMMSAQLEQHLKFEFRVPVYGVEAATACASLNYHQDHFGELFEIDTPDGRHAHSACIGFGLERCAVALFAQHGTDVDRWPSTVKDRLWP
jgi:seryl-tRNA synthetase